MTPAELARAIERGDPVHLLDVRNRDEYEEWHITDETVETSLVPYSKFMMAEVRDSVEDLLAEYDVPRDVPLVAVCGRGEASDYVAELLRERGLDAENLDDGMRGWATVYDARDVTESVADDVTVLQYERPASGCLAYLVVSGEEAVVVDPLRAFASRYVEDARADGAEVVAAIDTHVHADHVSGVRAVHGLTGADIVLPEKARARGLAVDEAPVRFVSDGDEVHVGDATLTAVHTPGHTSEMTAYRLCDLCFVGDGLFLESVARPDLEAGDAGAVRAARRLYRTLTETYAELGDDVRIAPAHVSSAAERAADGTYTARLGALRDRLTAFSLDEAEFVEYVLEAMPPRPANYEEIIETNLGRESMDDEAAFEAELGPNNCAATTVQS
jgi:glyoxylase-like metal-dependent hydrolase (beta-lactamase superfamily II)/rhodanese-related sulfurtransferase